MIPKLILLWLVTSVMVAWLLGRFIEAGKGK